MRTPRSVFKPRFALVLGLAAACGTGGQTEGAASPSIVLVTVDTLRREHLGCYGYPRDTSPNIDALAAESLVFDRALAPMATTFPSHLSMLTGLYAHQHGRTSNKQGVENPFASSSGVASFARALGEAGYDTAAIVSSRVLDERTGISDGFRHFHCPPAQVNPAMADVTTDRALEWLDGRRQDGPFLLWVHYWDTHEPNEPSEPFATRFRRDAAVDAWVAERGFDLPLLTEKFQEHDRIWERFLGEPPPAPEAERAPRDVDVARLAELVARYDADVAHVDHHLGRLFDRLRELELWNESLILFTADHGQSLGESGVFGHGKILNINTFVPLILRLPDGRGEAPRRIDTVVSLIDVPPTLLGRMDAGLLPAFRAQLEGVDVLAGGHGREGALTQEATSFRRREGPAGRYALVTPRWKYVYDLEEEHELYDLEGGGEGVNVLPDHPDVAQRLRGRVEALLARRPDVGSGEAAPADEVEEMLETLHGLGYVDEG